jgi:hypothetical protein
LTDEEERLLTGTETGSVQSNGRKEAVSMYQAIANPRYRKAVLVVIMIMIAQQLTGKFSLSASVR